MRVLIAGLMLVVASQAAAQTPPDKYVDSDGVRIRFIEAGAGEPVVLVHGYTVNTEANWMNNGVFANLARDHRVIAFDLRGHGKSDKPHDPAKYGAEVTLDAVRLLDHLQIPRAHFVGYSLGAVIIAKLMTTHPDRLITATLGAHAGYRNWRPEFDASAVKRAEELEGDVPFRSLLVALTPRDQPARTDEEIRKMSAAMEAANDVKALAAYNRAGTRALNSTDTEISAVKVPVLSLMGSLDNVPSVNRLQMLLPSMKLVVIEGATHAGARGAAGRPEFVAAVREFVASHRVGVR